MGSGRVIGHLNGVFESFRRRKSGAPDQFTESPAVEEFHGDKVQIVGCLEIVDMKDVGVIECG